jgi:hypothetical protein
MRLAATFLMIFLCVAARLAAQEVLTNATIVSLTKSHLGDKLIVEMIQDHRGKYVLTSSALIALKQQGVSDEVIEAMRAKMGESSNDSTARDGKSSGLDKPVALACDVKPNEWKMCDVPDPITNKTNFEADLYQRLAGQHDRPRFEVVGTCDVAALYLKATYVSTDESSSTYKWGPSLGAQRVTVRLAIDGRSGAGVSLPMEFTNQAKLAFLRPLTSDETKNTASIIFEGLASLVSVAKPAEIFDAKSVKIELPLANGGLPILDFKPQDPEFHQFASKCSAGFSKAEAAAAEAAIPAAVKEYDRQYGAPSVFDSYANLFQKASNHNNKALLNFLSGKGPVPGASDTPGQKPAGPRVPGDVIDPKMRWDAPETQTVWVRYTDSHPALTGGKAEKVAQVILEPSALTALKERRAALIALGVSETPPKAEPDPPPSTLPPDWTTRPWFVCPHQYGPSSTTWLVGAQPAAPGQRASRVEIRSATPVEIVGKRAVTGHTEFDLRLEGHPDQTYSAPSWQLHASCSTGAAYTTSIPASRTPAPAGSPAPDSTAPRPEDASGTGNIPDTLAQLTIHSGFAGQPNPLAGTRFYLMPDDFTTTLNKVGIRIPKGLDPSRAFRDICRGDIHCLNNLVKASTDHAAALGVSDANGDAKLVVQPGEYYVRIYGFDSTKHHIIWYEKIILTPGANSFIADAKNAKLLPEK